MKILCVLLMEIVIAALINNHQPFCAMVNYISKQTAITQKLLGNVDSTGMLMYHMSLALFYL